MIVHGGPGMSHDYLAPDYTRLLADDLRLVFYDQRASGRSTGIEDTSRLTMEQFVEDLDAVRRALDLERMNLAGHSFGGILAMLYAAEHPDRVRKLLLLDTSAASWELNMPFFRRTLEERWTETHRREMEAITAEEGAESDPEAMKRYNRLFFTPFFRDTTLADSLELGIDEGWLANYNVTNPLVWGRLEGYDFHDRLEAITAPTLILHGEASITSNEAQMAIDERIPVSRLVILEDVGHFLAIEAPGAFEAAVKACVW